MNYKTFLIFNLKILYSSQILIKTTQVLNLKNKNIFCDSRVNQVTIRIKYFSQSIKSLINDIKNEFNTSLYYFNHMNLKF